MCLEWERMRVRGWGKGGVTCRRKMDAGRMEDSRGKMDPGRSPNWVNRLKGGDQLVVAGDLKGVRVVLEVLPHLDASVQRNLHVNKTDR